MNALDKVLALARGEAEMSTDLVELTWSPAARLASAKSRAEHKKIGPHEVEPTPWKTHKIDVGNSDYARMEHWQEHLPLGTKAEKSSIPSRTIVSDPEGNFAGEITHDSYGSTAKTPDGKSHYVGIYDPMRPLQQHREKNASGSKPESLRRTGQGLVRRSK